jgi:hypothetical protein
MSIFHHHDWKQVTGAYPVNKKGIIIGAYFYCEDCNAVHCRLFKNCPVYEYDKGDAK